MEFVKGKDLEQLGPHAKAFFQREHGQRLLKEMGQLTCLDIVTNNWDRLPIIWDNEGNFRNLYLEEEEGPDNTTRWNVVGIDQGLSAVKKEVHPEGHEKYMNRVEALMDQIVEKPNEEAAELLRFRECLYTSLALELTSQDSLEIQAGILESARAFARLELKDLVDLKEKVRNLIRQDWSDVWANGVEGIHIPGCDGRTWVQRGRRGVLNIHLLAGRPVDDEIMVLVDVLPGKYNQVSLLQWLLGKRANAVARR